KALGEEGFSNGEVEETDTRETEPGTVLSCDLEPGEDADREGPVTRTVSARLPVPAETGEKAGDAREPPRSPGPTVEDVREFSDDVEKNTVSCQDPEEGAQVGPGDTVTITVSDGKEEFDVPDVTGKTVEEAEKELKDLGLKVKVTVILGGDRVTDYKPKGKVRKGDEVELIVTPFARGGGGGQGNGRGNRDD